MSDIKSSDFGADHEHHTLLALAGTVPIPPTPPATGQVSLIIIGHHSPPKEGKLPLGDQYHFHYVLKSVNVVSDGHVATTVVPLHDLRAVKLAEGETWASDVNASPIQSTNQTPLRTLLANKSEELLNHAKTELNKLKEKDPKPPTVSYQTTIADRAVLYVREYAQTHTRLDFGLTAAALTDVGTVGLTCVGGIKKTV